MDGLTSVTCTFSRTTYEAADHYSVREYVDKDSKHKFTAFGNDLPDRRGLTYALTGRWETRRKYGKQFRVLLYDVPKMDTRAEVIAYLKSLRCGVTTIAAGNIYKKYGSGSWDVINDNPAELITVVGVGKKTVAKLETAVKEKRQNAEIIRLFSDAGLEMSYQTLNAIRKKFGDSAYQKLKENPYQFRTVSGLGFDRLDALAMYLGFPKDFPPRMECGVFHALGTYSVRGSVCVPKDQMIAEMSKYLGVSEAQCQTAANAAWRDGKLKGTNNLIYSAESFRQENSIADNIARLLRADEPITGIEKFIKEYEAENFPLAASQREAVRNAFRHRVSIITGGPGTGKTTVTKAILYAHRRVYGSESDPLLLAPTGRASRRLSEATGYPAMTIHSAVGYRPGDDEEGSADACDGELTGNIIIVDECSMMDQFITSVLLEKVESGTRVVFVGDPDQLPSVGCGNVLADMIRSGVVPTTKLSVIYRQAAENPIVANAQAIHQGKTELTYASSFKFISATGEDAFNKACNMYVRCVSAYGIDNVVLLNPQRNNTNLSVDRFNHFLQDAVNPRHGTALTVGKNEYRIGDKVMMLKNTEDARNGDIGFIRNISVLPDEDDEDKNSYSISIEWNDSGESTEYSPDEMTFIDLAYCSTVHKAQGSEYDTVIMVVSNEHPAMLKRNLVYTGVTRARKNVALVGEQSALAKAIANDREETRYTLLAQRLRKAVGE